MEAEIQEQVIVNYFAQQAKEGKTAEEAIRNLFELFDAADKMPKFRA